LLIIQQIIHTINRHICRYVLYMSDKMIHINKLYASKDEHSAIEIPQRIGFYERHDFI